MSLLAGIMGRKKEPVDEYLLQNINTEISVMDYDSVQIKKNQLGNIVMGQFLIYTTPDIKLQNIEIRIDDKYFLIAFNGRLDYKKDLLKKLHINESSYIIDSEIIVRAYLKWGESFLRNLEGDFSVGIWDSSNNTTILACDKIGIKNLFYYYDYSKIIWGTTIKAIRSILQGSNT